MNRWGAKMFRVLLLMGFICASALPGLSESLWVPAFSGYITGIPSYDIGDIVRVLIDAESSLKYRSSRTDSENVVLEFSGGKTDGLFSFLPDAQASSTVDLKGEETVSIGTSLAARIVGRDDTGALQIQGKHSVSLSGAEQTLEIEGWVLPSSIDREKTVSISNLADMRLTFTALIDDVQEIISADDITEIITDELTLGNLSETAETAPPDGVGEATVPELPATTDITEPGEILPIQPEPARGLILDEEKAEELLLLFINRFIDWVF